jgi:hypothetical protein
LLGLLLQFSGQEIRPYLLEDSAYPIRLYLLKNFKLGNPIFNYQIGFYSSVNLGRVCENAFAALKSHLIILKAFDMVVDKCAMVTLICTVLHNFCEFHKEAIMFQGIVGCKTILL